MIWKVKNNIYMEHPKFRTIVYGKSQLSGMTGCLQRRDLPDTNCIRFNESEYAGLTEEEARQLTLTKIRARIAELEAQKVSKQ